MFDILTPGRHVEACEEPGNVGVTGLSGQTTGPHHRTSVHLPVMVIIRCISVLRQFRVLAVNLNVVEFMCVMTTR